MKPKLLDLFCGAGGASMGYHLAGFDVTGVDIKPQKHYPFEFFQDDAIEFCRKHGSDFDVIHSSPPCQAHTVLKFCQKNNPGYDKRHIDLIPQTREVLKQIGKPYIIENVMLAPLEGNVIVLCGTYFGLKVYRHRQFETSWFMLQIPHIAHRDNVTGAGKGKSNKGFISVTGNGGFGHGVTIEYVKMAMGIDWMTRKELSQAIPPAYTRYIGKIILEMIK